MLCRVKLISSNILPCQASFLLSVVFFFYMYGALYAESVAYALAIKYELVLWLQWVTSLPFCYLRSHEKGRQRSLLLQEFGQLVRLLWWVLKASSDFRQNIYGEIFFAIQTRVVLTSGHDSFMSFHGLISLCMFNSPISETFNLKIQRGSIYKCKRVLVLILLSVPVLNNVYQVGPAPGLSALLPPLLPGRAGGDVGSP